MTTPHFPVYYASAGSGKTFNLVREYLERCLKDPEPDKVFKRILAITFTNKAAGEMKDRVVRALRTFVTAEGTSDAMAQQIQENLGLQSDEFTKRCRLLLSGILHEYDGFSVGTIDKFNSRILRTFALDLDLPLSYEVEMETDRLIEEAVDRLLDIMGEDEGVTRLLTKYSAQQIRDNKDWRIQRDLLDKGKLLFQEQHRSHLEGQAEMTPKDYLEAIGKIQSRREALGHQARKGIEKIQALIDRPGQGPMFFAGKALNKWLVKHRALRYASELEMQKEQDGTVMYRVGWIEKALEHHQWINKTAPADDQDWLERHEGELHGLFSQLFEAYRADLPLSLYARNIYGMAVLTVLDRSLDEVKRERNVVHISEFNRTIADQVRQQPVLYIYERLGERYYHYFIDEFQDTSVMQWQNLLPLTHEALSKGGSSMVVGDGKQAIYRWRGGEVESFLELTAGHKPHYQSGAGLVQVPFAPDPVSLKDNWRSRHQIVSFNNELYSEAAGELEDPRFVDLYKASGQSPKGKEGGHISLHAYSEKLNKEDLWPEMFQWTEDRIKGARGQGFDFADLCILVRKKEEGQAIAEFLQRSGTPVISNESLLLSASPEVNVLIQFLRWKTTGNTKDAVSRILLYLFDRLEVPKAERHHWLRKALNEGAVEEVLNTWMPAWNAAGWEQRTLYEKMNSLSGWIPGFPMESAYVEFFLDLCHQFSVRSKGTEAEFLEWWDDTLHKHSIVVPAGMDAVQIMTIHKAKGLEFPVVLVPAAHWAPRTADQQDWYTLPEEEGEEYGLSEVFLNMNQNMLVTSPDLAQLYRTSQEALRLDDLNLLYVATTRAVDELHIAFKPDADKQGVQRYFDRWLKAQEREWTPGSSDSWGTPVEGRVSKKPDDVQEEVVRGKPEEWRDKLRLSFESNRYWGLGGEARPYGIEAHRILQEIESVDDADRVLEQWEVDGLLNASAREGLEKDIRDMLARPEVAKYFDPASRSRNEASILLPNGGAQRPDRLVFHPDGGVSIVDFKTGAPSAKHRQQVDEYANLLNSAHVNVVNRALIYVGPYALDENW